ncbi:hypothetical protein M9Y90_05445 [Leptospira interrogans]|uniref:hypothetical protein n=1 Tax=Leptospira interrogans TaxID=173 RepID=UPI000348322B|nr:hypothetical protein [Leptospira interrogans]MCL8310121.1 hypothetical protein [Leptospira interrogans]
MKQKAKKTTANKKPQIKAITLLTKQAENELRKRLGKKTGGTLSFCKQNGFTISEFNRALDMIPTRKSSLVIIALEAEGIKIPETKRKKLLIGKERATRLKLNREIIDEHNPKPAA